MRNCTEKRTLLSLFLLVSFGAALHARTHDAHAPPRAHDTHACAADVVVAAAFRDSSREVSDPSSRATVTSERFVVIRFAAVKKVLSAPVSALPFPRLSLTRLLVSHGDSARSTESERARGQDTPSRYTSRGASRGAVIESRRTSSSRHTRSPLPHHGSPLLRDHGEQLPGLRRSGAPRRRPGPAEPPADRGTIRAQQLVLRVRAEGHLAAHAQDRRRVDVGGECRFRFTCRVCHVINSQAYIKSPTRRRRCEHRDLESASDTSRRHVGRYILLPRSRNSRL